MFWKKYSYSRKFYAGIILTALSLFTSKIAIIIFIVYPKLYLRFITAIVYLISWPALIIGFWWIGREYADAVKKYVSYQFYGQSLRLGTKRMVNKTKEKTKLAVIKTKERTNAMLQKTTGHINRRLKGINRRRYPQRLIKTFKMKHSRRSNKKNNQNKTK